MMFKEEIQRVGEALGLKGKFLSDWGFDDIIMAAGYDPYPPEVETKEVKIYASVDSTTGRVWDMGSKEQMEIAVSPDAENLIKIVELTGTYNRKIKPKIRRREEICRPIPSPDYTLWNFPEDAKFFGEWYE